MNAVRKSVLFRFPVTRTMIALNNLQVLIGRAMCSRTATGLFLYPLTRRWFVANSVLGTYLSRFLTGGPFLDFQLEHIEWAKREIR